MRASILAVVLATNLACAEHAASVLAADGSIDPGRLQAFIASVEPSIRSYPPQFRDQAHRDEIMALTQKVGTELINMDYASVSDPGLVTDVAHVLAMAHNLDFDTARQAKQWFEAALAASPNDRRTNYLFGMFLVSTRTHFFESEPYLEAALALGEDDALYTLGLVALRKGDQDKALEMLTAYRDNNPDNQRVEQMIDAIEDGTLKFYETE